MTMHRARRAAAVALLSVIILVTVYPSTGLSAQTPPTVAFTDVNVIPMDTERVLEHHTVIVRDGRIVAMAPSDELEPPADALTIDGSGRYLMPGLADMHVHAGSEEVLRVFVAHGITTIRNMWGAPMHLDWRARISRGEMLGPSIFTTGPLIDGSPPIWDGSTVVETTSDAERVVQEHSAAGYDFIKVYNRLKPDVYQALVATARQEGIPVVGHVPTAVGLRNVLDARQASIEHLTGFLYPTATASSPFDSTNWVAVPVARRSDLQFEIAQALTDGSTAFADLYDDAKLAAIAAASRDAGTWHVPTLVVFRFLTVEEASRRLMAPEMRYVDPQTRSFWDSAKDRYADRTTDDVHSLEIFNEAKRRRVKTLYDNGARILLGSDTPNPFVVPGLSIHEELRNLVRAGLTPYQAISAGTRDAADFLGARDSLGTVAVGNVADLVLVDGNPLTDVTNVAQRSGVMVRGRWIPARELVEILDEVAAAYGGR